MHLWELPMTVQHVVEAARRRDLNRLARAIKEMPAMGEEAQKAYPALLEALKGGDGNVRGMVLKLLEQLGPPGKERLPEVLGLLDRGASVDAKLFALEALIKAGPDEPKALPALATALKDPEARVRERAARALGEFGPAAQAAFPTLVELVKGDDAAARKTALAVLDKLGPPGKERLAELKALLDRKAPLEARQYALTALGKLGGDAVGAVGVLAEAMQDPEAKIRVRAAAALGDLGPAAREAAPALRAVLRKSDDVELLNAALAALTTVGLNAVDDAEAIGRLLENTDAGLRLKGLQTLLQLAPEKLTCAKLLKLAGDGDADVAKAAEEAVRARPAAVTADDLAALRAALRNDNKAVVVLAVDLLTKAGRQAEKAAADLLPLAADADAAMRTRAIKAIDAVAPSGKEAIQVRLDALKDEDRAIRLEAAATLAKTPGVEKEILAKQVLPMLIKALRPETADDLKDDGPWKQAALALAQGGKPAAEALFRALDEFAGRDDATGVTRLRLVLVIKELGATANSNANQFKLIELEKSDPFLYTDPNTGQTYYPVRLAAKQARLALQAK
jgi:HEAT repeat protein